MDPITLIVLITVVLLVLWLITLYNRLIRERNLVREAWSGVEVQLMRRHDLIPNLVRTAQGYAQHERGLLEEIAEKRSMSAAAPTVRDRAAAEAQLGGVLGRLFAVAEAYPDLKADRNFLDLQNELGAIEDQIQLARRYYNGSVREYNTLVESFPNVAAAGPLGFRPADFFDLETQAPEAATAARRAPEVTF